MRVDPVDGCGCGRDCSFCCGCRTPANGSLLCRGLGTRVSLVAGEETVMTDGGSHLDLDCETWVVIDPWSRVSCLQQVLEAENAGSLLTVDG